MPAANTIALVAVLATAATAITVPLIAAVAQSKSDRRRFEQDRLTKDFDELRALLDESSSELFRVLQVLERGELTEAETEEAVKPLATLNARLVMRLGRKHEVVRAFKHTVEVAWPEDVNDTDATDDADTDDTDELDPFEAFHTFVDTAQTLVGSPVKPLRRD